MINIETHKEEEVIIMNPRVIDKDGGKIRVGFEKGNEIVEDKVVKKNLKSDDSDEECNEFVNTVIKCDICYTDKKDDDLNRCKSCLVNYHSSCYSSKGNRHKEKNLCEKCAASSIYEPCLICLKTTGSMVRCNNKRWVHYFCLSFFQKLFSLIDNNNLCFDRQKNKKDKKDLQCALCKKKSEYVLRCPNCDIYFHPYCGLLFNFDYITFIDKKQTPQVICENHHYYKTEDKISLQFSERNTCSTLRNNVINNPPFKMRTRMKRKLKPEKVEKILPKNRKVKPCSSYIFSLDYKKLKKYGEDRIKRLIGDYKDWNIFMEHLDSISPIEMNVFEPVGSYMEKFGTIEQVVEKYNITSNIGRRSEPLLDETKRISLFKAEDDEYLAVYDTLALNKTNFKPKDIAEENNEFELFTCRVSNQIYSKNIKFKSVEFISGKFRFELDDSDSLPNEEDIKGVSRVQRHLKLINFQEINNRDKVIEHLRRDCEKEISTLLNNITLNPSDVDYEILLANEMLRSRISNNFLLLERLKNNYWEYNNNEDVKLLSNSNLYIKPYKAIVSYNFIKTKLTLGCSDKTIEDLVKFRGGRSGKARSKEEYNQYFNELQAKREFNESDCCICMHCDYEDGNTIVFCDLCNVGMHPECYGLREIPEGDYFCNLCASKTQGVSCYLCGRIKGAFKLVEKDIWAHSFCILLSEILMFKDYELMDSVGFIQAKQANMNKCCVCNSNGGELFKCTGCDEHYFHALCAYLEGYKIDIVEKQFTHDEYNLPTKVKLTPFICCDTHHKRDKSTIRYIRELTYYKEFTRKNCIFLLNQALMVLKC
jgi:hypothetical protein